MIGRAVLLGLATACLIAFSGTSTAQDLQRQKSAVVKLIAQSDGKTRTGTGFIVTPVVALVRPGFELQADPFEVAEVFEVPLAFLMNPAHHRRHAVEIGGVRREFLSMPWQGFDSEGRPRRYFVWGATAGMLRNLYRFLAA